MTRGGGDPYDGLVAAGLFRWAMRLASAVGAPTDTCDLGGRSAIAAGFQVLTARPSQKTTNECA